MKIGGLTAVICMILVIKNVVSVCPESGCVCGEACVDGDNNWCNNEDGQKCSCKKGCLLFNKLVNPGDEKNIYCRDCRCPATENEGIAECSASTWCKPKNVILHVNYPYNHGENPECFKGITNDSAEIERTN